MKFVNLLALFALVVGNCGNCDSATPAVQKNPESSTLGNSTFSDKDLAKKEPGSSVPIENKQQKTDGQKKDGVASVDVVNIAADSKEKRSLSISLGDSRFEFATRLRIDGLYGVNLKAINDANNEAGPTELDKIGWPGRHTLDAWVTYFYGSKNYGYDAVRFNLGVRNRAIWGNENSIFDTGRSMIQHVDARIGDHSHPITREVIWLRELWIEFALKNIFNTCQQHTCTLGIFPFSVGRGISLGDAYSVDAEFFGESSPFAIDQYAPGIKLSGDLIPSRQLRYDLYFEISDNQSDNFDHVNEPIKAQEFGRRDFPARGFGVFSYIFAGRLQWKPRDKDADRICVEPYALYVNTSEGKVRFLGDGRYYLGTFGLACEFESGQWEGGFDSAFQVGQGNVLGWDSNMVVEENRGGTDVYVFNKVLAGPPCGVGRYHSNRSMPIACTNPQRALDTKVNAACVNSSPQAQKYNGKKIETPACTGLNLFNSPTRFNDPYKVFIRGGAMFVADVAYKFECLKTKIAMTGGFATGDEDPNRNLVLHDVSTGNEKFGGFLPQQDLYQGKRVKSILFFDQAKISRLLSQPDPNIAELELIESERPTDLKQRFSNIILTGVSLQVKPKLGSREWDIRTNLLGFWSWIRPLIFNRVGMRERADRYYGTEWNVMVETYLVPDLKFFTYGAIFVPGSFFTSYKEANLKIPSSKAILGDSTAYYVTAGFEYKF